MQQITSSKNAFIQQIRALREKKVRDMEHAFLIEGVKWLEEALAARQRITHAFFDEQKQASMADLMARCLACGAEIYLLMPHVLSALCDTKTPQGCAARVLYTDHPMPKGLLLALDGVQDPGNVGTMVRTVDAAGFAGILLSGDCADPYGPKALRASMGSLFRVPVLQGDLTQMLCQRKEEGYTLFSADVEGEDVYALKNLPAKLVLVIGSEGRGVRHEIRALCHLKLTLPMRGGAQSLNAAVAAGILLYEITRPQR